MMPVSGKKEDHFLSRNKSRANNRADTPEYLQKINLHPQSPFGGAYAAPEKRNADSVLDPVSRPCYDAQKEVGFR